VENGKSGGVGTPKKQRNILFSIPFAGNHIPSGNFKTCKKVGSSANLLAADLVARSRFAIYFKLGPLNDSILIADDVPFDVLRRLAADPHDAICRLRTQYSEAHGEHAGHLGQLNVGKFLMRLASVRREERMTVFCVTATCNDNLSLTSITLGRNRVINSIQ
jgi:hypothetical protein